MIVVIMKAWEFGTTEAGYKFVGRDAEGDRFVSDVMSSHVLSGTDQKASLIIIINVCCSICILKPA